MSPFPFAWITAAASALILVYVPPSHAQIDAPPPTASTEQIVPAGGSSRFWDDSRKTLRLLEEQIVRVGTSAIDAPGTGDRPDADLTGQNLLVGAAQAEYRHAQLRREAAELALKEYHEATAKQQQADCEAEVKLARADQETAARRVEQARQRLAAIRPMLNDSTSGIATGWKLEAAVLGAELGEKKAGFALELADSKLRVLTEYEGRKRRGQLGSEIEKARSEELAKKAAWELERAKLKKLQAPVDVRAQLTTLEQQLLTLLARAIPIEEQCTARLGDGKNQGEPSDSVRKDIVDLSRQFQVIVDEAEEIASASAWASLKSRIDRAGGGPAPGLASHLPGLTPRGGQAQPAPQDQSVAGAVRTGFVADSRRTSRSLREEIARLASRAIASVGAGDPQQGDLAGQQITVMSAAAQYENAKLTREVAEIAVREYEEGIYLQDKQTAEGEFLLAKADAERARDMIEVNRQRLAVIKKASKGSAYDLMNEYTFEDALGDSERREPKARLAVEAARAKAENLDKYIRPRRLKELNAEVEKARAEELAKHARWESEKLKLSRLQAPGRDVAGPIHEQRLLEVVKQAIQLADQVEAKLDQVKTEAGAGDSLRAEIAGLLKQLDSTVESGRNESAAAAWDRLKSKIPAAANGDSSAKP